MMRGSRTTFEIPTCCPVAVGIVTGEHNHSRSINSNTNEIWGNIIGLHKPHVPAHRSPPYSTEVKNTWR